METRRELGERETLDLVQPPPPQALETLGMPSFPERSRFLVEQVEEVTVLATRSWSRVIVGWGYVAALLGSVLMPIAGQWFGSTPQWDVVWVLSCLFMGFAQWLGVLFILRYLSFDRGKFLNVHRLLALWAPKQGTYREAEGEMKVDVDNRPVPGPVLRVVNSMEQPVGTNMGAPRYVTNLVFRDRVVRVDSFKTEAEAKLLLRWLARRLNLSANQDLVTCPAVTNTIVHSSTLSTLIVVMVSLTLYLGWQARGENKGDGMLYMGVLWTVAHLLTSAFLLFKSRKTLAEHVRKHFPLSESAPTG